MYIGATTTFFGVFFRKKIHLFKALISIYPGAAAVVLAFFKDEIIKSTSLGIYLTKQFFFQHRQFDLDGIEPNYYVIIYWLLLIVWIFFYFAFVTGESKASKENNESVRAAIFRSPNPNIYIEYKIFFEAVMKCLNSMDDTIESKNIQFGKALAKICAMTSAFVNQKNTENIYGANIMLYIDSEPSLLEDLHKEEKQWVFFRSEAISSLDGVLYLVPELSHRTTDGVGSKLMAAPICLPVRKNHAQTKGNNINLPGAPTAVIKGQFFFENVLEPKNYLHLEDREKRINETYWIETLPEVRSIYSIAIPGVMNEQKHKIIGVLNIDSKQPDILGTAKEYYETFFSLMYPIACLIGEELEEYSQLYIPHLKAKYPKPSN